MWKAVKILKSKFSPKFIQMRNTNGMLVPLKKTAEAITDHLEQKRWSNEPEAGKTRCTKKGLLAKWFAKNEEESKNRQIRSFAAEKLKHAIN